jgi:hypothetical protein
MTSFFPISPEHDELLVSILFLASLLLLTSLLMFVMLLAFALLLASTNVAGLPPPVDGKGY